MKFLTLLMTGLLVAMTALSISGCRTKETKTETIKTHVNPVSGAETVEKETTTTVK
jgi:uncharacterized lipoprotein YehR (DUF1307 family)